MAEQAMILLVFLPLLAACLAFVLAGTPARVIAGITMAALPALMLPITVDVIDQGEIAHSLGGHAAPLGIRLVADGSGALMLWLVAIIGSLASLHAWFSFRDQPDAEGTFWPLWLILIAGLNGMFLSCDLFNLYVAMELVTLSAVALVALAGGPVALSAAMRYLLLAMLASLAYLLGVVLIYNATGTMDFRLLAADLEATPEVIISLVLITVGLLLKTAIFPLHVWLPRAHASAPGPVSAVLSALVVKASLFVLYRIWFWSGAELDLAPAEWVLGLAGAGAIIYGSLAALVQSRLKLLVAYSTVAQLGYLMMIFPLASLLAWPAANYQIMAHALAKAALFLAAANILRGQGTDRLQELGGLDRRQPIDLFAFGIAGVSIMGLPPSGGFLAKWMFLETAWAQAAWGWLAVMVIGSLLAAAYIFRALAGMLTSRQTEFQARIRPVHRAMSLSALALALLALASGFASSPILELLGLEPPGLSVDS